MKKIAVTLLIVWCAIGLSAQQYRGNEAEKYVQGAEMVRFKKGMDFPVNSFSG
jgi:hypothetical protein